jgi:hypothetical protein
MVKSNENKTSPDDKVKNKGGRPKGSSNRVNRKVRLAALNSGENPLQFVLRVMRAPIGGKVDGHTVTWEDKLWATQQAMPKLHPNAPQTTNTHLSGAGGGPVSIAVTLDPNKLDSMGLDDIIRAEEQVNRLQSGEAPAGQEKAGTNGSASYDRS